jgi:hypothetical protein
MRRHLPAATARVCALCHFGHPFSPWRPLASCDARVRSNSASNSLCAVSTSPLFVPVFALSPLFLWARSHPQRQGQWLPAHRPAGQSAKHTALKLAAMHAGPAAGTRLAEAPRRGSSGARRHAHASAAGHALPKQPPAGAVRACPSHTACVKMSTFGPPVGVGCIHRPDCRKKGGRAPWRICPCL